MVFKRLLILILTVTPLLSIQAHAADSGQFHLGVSAGQVGLFNDPGADGANGLGAGLSVGYMLDSSFELELQYLASSHTNIDHSDISVGANYYLSDYEHAYPHISAGMTFLTNHFKGQGASGTAAGLFLGGGLGFELSRDWTLGPEVRYQKAFESHGHVGGLDQITVGDSYMILLRLSWTPSSGD
jgi:opacity protein-like surface antigen